MPSHMKHLPTICFGLIAIALGTLVTLQQMHGNLDFLFGSPSLGKGDRVYQFDPKNVGRIEILTNEAESLLINKGGTWIMESPKEDYADARFVQSILNFSSKLKIEDTIERETVDSLSDFGLRDTRIEIKLFDKSGRHLCHFDIGRYTAWRSLAEEETQLANAGEEAKDRTSYATVVIRPKEDDKKDYLYICADVVDPKIRREGIRSLFSQGLLRFRDHRVFYNPAIIAAEITLQEKNSEIILRRSAPSTKAPWLITKPFDLPANEATAKQLVLGLTNLSADAVFDESALTLPEPLPENIDFSVSLRFYNPDGTLGTPVKASFYPPEKEEDPFVYAVVHDEPEHRRPAILRIPRVQGTPLASIPRNVNDLRDRTITSLQVADIDGLQMTDGLGRHLKLKLEKDPHERAFRWHAEAYQFLDESGRREINYQGPCNEEQVNSLFLTLFKNKIKQFTDDAATAMKLPDYGLDQPIRQIEFSLRNGELAEFIIGQKILPHYYAVREKGGKVMEITRTDYDEALKGKLTANTSRILQSPLSETQIDLDLYGLKKAKTVTVKNDTQSADLKVAVKGRAHFYAHRMGSSRVVEIDPGSLTSMPLASFRWQNTALWNIDAFEVKGLVIKRAGQPVLQLNQNFVREKWTAQQGSTNVSAKLNINKANRFLKRLTELKVNRWLGPISENASELLQQPELEITVLTENIDETGKIQGLTPHTLKLTPVPGQAKLFHYGSSSTNGSFFLLTDDSKRALEVELLE